MDRTAVLPEGNQFNFWEKEVKFTKELYVDCAAPAGGDGSKEKPFQKIQDAADIAGPGTHVWIASGEYHEWVHPEQGGTDPENMIVYEAVETGKAVIKASEVITDFEESHGWRMGGFGEAADPDVKIYKHRLSPDMFRGYNPFCAVNILHDRLFIEYDKTDMTPYLNRRGMVFVDGKPLKQVALYRLLTAETNTYFVEANGMTVHFRLENEDDPANHLVEFTVREQCFAPQKEELSYIKLKGLVCAHAAMGAPVPQRGSISANRGHHWVVEDCTVDWANATGMDLGAGCWNMEHPASGIVGYSVVRRCKILDAGVCGLAGLYAQEMLVEDTLFEGTGWQRMELSWEAGAIKYHDTHNSLFRRNVFRRTYAADHIWLDCNNENNRITQNLFLDGINQREAIFIECTREGINLIDNNIFWNIEGRFDPAKIPVEPGSSGWYKMVENDVINGYAVYGEGTDRMNVRHNFIGKVRGSGYYAKPVAFRTSSFMRGGTSRDAKLDANLFYKCEQAAITFPTEKNDAQDNLYVKQGGGFLRIMYPAPEVCLDLKSWTEFYGFDKNAQEGWFDFDIDTAALTLTVKDGGALPMRMGSVQRDLITDPTAIKGVAADDVVTTDFYGDEVGETYIPGPFSKLEPGKIYNIDPRKL